MEVKQAYGMFSDLWKFYKKFEAINKDDEIAWSNLCNEATRIRKKYENDFCDSLILPIVSELSKRSEDHGVKMGGD